MLRYLILLTLFLFHPTVLIAQAGIEEFGKAGTPIDITADQLTVNSKKNLAVFKGTVDAKQGDIALKSDEMKVYYHESGSSTQQSSLSKIITKGITKLDVPEKKASSDNGIYDVDKGIIILQGNVVLNKDQSVLYGDMFWYDVKSGKSSITSNKKPVEGKTIEKKRVKGIFVPRKKPSNE